jgi:CheY-like chemotaxis protein
MSDTTSAPTREEFAQWLHDALNQLYDSPYLQTHPLAQLLAEPGMDTLQHDQHLRRVLINAIEQLRPQAGIPAQSPKWRAFQLLELRYIEGLSAAEIMRELALSRSTYFREQARTMDALTAALWEQWQQRTTTSLELAIAGASREQLAQAEVERLSAHATWEVTDVTALLQTLRPIAEPLARSRGAALSITMPPRLSAPRADRVLLRQTLLNIITYALDVVPAGQLDIRGHAAAHEVAIHICATNTRDTGSGIGGVHRQGVGLEVCRQLMTAMGGELRIESSANIWQARLVWAIAPPRVLLVVDDNEGFIDLFRRYLNGHNWQVIDAAGVAAARALLADRQPTAIALDVMMPKEDGWEFLITLRADECTHSIPVIICSVLNEPQLARTLGASMYLPKPITQAALLQALAQCAPVAANPARAR